MAVGTLVTVSVTLATVAAIVASVKSIIQDTDEILDTVTERLNKINSVSSGEFVDKLKDATGVMDTRFRELIDHLGTMLKAIEAVKDEYERADMQSASNIQSANSSLR